MLIMHEYKWLLSGVTIVPPIRNDLGRVWNPHANVWAARPKLPPHGKEGRNKVADRPT